MGPVWVLSIMEGHTVTDSCLRSSHLNSSGNFVFVEIIHQFIISVLILDDDICLLSCLKGNIHMQTIRLKKDTCHQQISIKSSNYINEFIYLI